MSEIMFTLIELKNKIVKIAKRASYQVRHATWCKSGSNATRSTKKTIISDQEEEEATLSPNEDEPSSFLKSSGTERLGRQCWERTSWKRTRRKSSPRKGVATRSRRIDTCRISRPTKCVRSRMRDASSEWTDPAARRPAESRLVAGLGDS